MPSTVLLRAESLAATRDERLLFADLAFQVGAGELWRIEGANGAGKTTLVRILAGLDQDHEGRVHYPAAADGAPWRSRVLYLGHLPGIKGGLTARENLAWLAALRGTPVRLDADTALARVGLRGYEDVPVAQLSAGQRRRVALARLHVEDAALWLLDEPFTALDRAGVALFEQQLADHVRAGGAVILTTHHELSVAVPVNRLALGRAA